MDEQARPEDVIWENTLDQGTWGCKVVRTGDSTGILTAWRTSDGEEILNQTVGLSYRAIFGPDVDDVMDWQERVIKAVDSR